MYCQQAAPTVSHATGSSVTYASAPAPTYSTSLPQVQYPDLLRVGAPAGAVCAAAHDAARAAGSAPQVVYATRPGEARQVVYMQQPGEVQHVPPDMVAGSFVACGHPQSMQPPRKPRRLPWSPPRPPRRPRRPLGKGPAARRRARRLRRRARPRTSVEPPPARYLRARSVAWPQVSAAYAAHVLAKVSRMFARTSCDADAA